MLKHTSPAGERATIKWIGAGAITYGVLYFLSNLFGEFLLPAEKPSGEITVLWRFLIYVGAWGLGASALVPALRALDRVYRRRGRITRAGSVGLRLAAAGAALQALFAAVYFGTAAATGDAADAAFLLFALGFLLMIAGSFTAGVSLIRTGTEPSVGALLLVAAVAAVVLIVTPYPVHDVALFTFAVTWIAIGSVLVRPVRLAPGRGVLGWSSVLGLLLGLTVPADAFARADVDAVSPRGAHRVESHSLWHGGAPPSGKRRERSGSAKIPAKAHLPI